MWSCNALTNQCRTGLVQVCQNCHAILHSARAHPAIHSMHPHVRLHTTDIGGPYPGSMSWTRACSMQLCLFETGCGGALHLQVLPTCPSSSIYEQFVLSKVMLFGYARGCWLLLGALQLSSMESFVVGGLARTIAAVVTCPITVVKTQMEYTGSSVRHRVQHGLLEMNNIMYCFQNKHWMSGPSSHRMDWIAWHIMQV